MFGLLDDDKELNDCLFDAALWARGNELRQLFVTVVMNCQVLDSHKLRENNYCILSEDITSMQRKRLRSIDSQLNAKQIESYTLLDIESIFLKMGRSLNYIQGMPIPNSS